MGEFGITYPKPSHYKSGMEQVGAGLHDPYQPLPSLYREPTTSHLPTRTPIVSQGIYMLQIGWGGEGCGGWAGGVFKNKVIIFPL